MWKKFLVTELDEISRLLSRGTKENQKKPYWSRVGDPDNNRTENFPMTTFFSLWRNRYTRTNAVSLLRSPFHTHTTLGRTLLEEESPRRRDLYLTKRNIHKRQTSMTQARFEPAILASERRQTHTFDRAVTWTGPKINECLILPWFKASQCNNLFIPFDDTYSCNQNLKLVTLCICTFVTCW
jgi:hypothetical protein